MRERPANTEKASGRTAIEVQALCRAEPDVSVIADSDGVYAGPPAGRQLQVRPCTFGVDPHGARLVGHDGKPVFGDVSSPERVAGFVLHGAYGAVPSECRELVVRADDGSMEEAHQGSVLGHPRSESEAHVVRKAVNPTAIPEDVKAFGGVDPGAAGPGQRQRPLVENGRGSSITGVASLPLASKRDGPSREGIQHWRPRHTHPH